LAQKAETRRQKRIRTVLKKRYGHDQWNFKVHGGPFQQDGIGDIMGVVCGFGFMFEVKEPDGTASQLQIETVKDYKRAGGIAAIIVEPEEAVRLIDRTLARARRCGFLR
jgi:hypothetical protein